jgi:hypothetical protein
MSKSLVAFAALVGIAIAAPPPAQAQAQQACGKRADIIKHLAGQYQESPVAIGSPTTARSSKSSPAPTAPRGR